MSNQKKNNKGRTRKETIAREPAAAVYPLNYPEKLEQFYNHLTITVNSMGHLCPTSIIEEKKKLERLHDYLKDFLGMNGLFRKTFAVENLVNVDKPVGKTQKESNREKGKWKKHLEFIKKLNFVMKTNFSDPDFTVRRCAGKLNISEATLYRKTSILTGKSPCELIRSYRLWKAVRLLKNQFGSITDIAFEVGFNSHTYFTRCFREKYHRLPSDFIHIQNLNEF